MRLSFEKKNLKHDYSNNNIVILLVRETAIHYVADEMPSRKITSNGNSGQNTTDDEAHTTSDSLYNQRNAAIKLSNVQQSLQVMSIMVLTWS